MSDERRRRNFPRMSAMKAGRTKGPSRSTRAMRGQNRVRCNTYSGRRSGKIHIEVIRISVNVAPYRNRTDPGASCGGPPRAE